MKTGFIDAGTPHRVDLRRACSIDLRLEYLERSAARAHHAFATRNRDLVSARNTQHAFFHSAKVYDAVGGMPAQHGRRQHSQERRMAGQNAETARSVLGAQRDDLRAVEQHARRRGDSQMQERTHDSRCSATGFALAAGGADEAASRARASSSVPTM